MAKKVEKVGRIYWEDPQGDLVPLQYVSKEDKARDRLVESVINDVEKHREAIKKLKEKIRTRVDTYLESMAYHYGENWKGNAKISNFANDKAVELSISEMIEFDEKLQIAKTKIDNCITRWTEGSNRPLAILVTKAFRADKAGRLNKRLILQLRTYDIRDTEWKEAMEIISDSIRVVASKSYYNFYNKDDEGKWHSIVINFSNL